MAPYLRHGALSLEAINPRLIRVDRKALLDAVQNKSFCSLILALIRQVKHTKLPALSNSVFTIREDSFLHC